MTIKSLLKTVFNNENLSDIALVDESNASISFGQLSNISHSIATVLKENFDNSYCNFILFANKSITSYSCLLATLLADKTIIPVDVKSPIERLLKIYNDCLPEGIFIETNKLNLFLPYFKDYSIIEIPNSNISIIKFNQAYNEATKNYPYVLYTSGSTGVPKGVKLSNKNILSFVNWAINYFPVSKNDVFCSVAPFHFDLSIFDIFVSLFYNAKLVLFNDETIRNPRLMNQLLSEHKVSVIYSTPTLLSLLVNYGKIERFNHSSLRVVNYAGEVFIKESLIRLKEHWKSAQFYNLYGPTETNVCSVFPISTKIEESFLVKNIGSICGHFSSKILIENDNVIDFYEGLKGELVVTGEGVFEGYLGIKDESIFIEYHNKKWYKTGDIVEVLSNDQLKFLHRKDRLIKRNGYRIELGEIENAIIEHKKILKVGVVTNYIKNKTMLYAFCETMMELSTEEVIAFLQLKLPDYMIPDKFILLETLPITSSGKLNYQKMVETL